NLVLDVGIQQRLGSVDTEQLQNARLGIVWIDDTEWGTPPSSYYIRCCRKLPIK
ncbi:hypothetical protein LEA_07225, partial [human gut metagenome]